MAHARSIYDGVLKSTTRMRMPISKHLPHPKYHGQVIDPGSLDSDVIADLA
jgi:hypothetical protein